MPLLLAYDDFLQILDCLDETDAADEELDAVLLQHLRADVDVRPPYGVIDVDERDPVGSQLVGMNVDLVLPHVTADAGDLADAFDGIELVAKIPVLDGTQLGEVEAFPLDGVPIDLTQRRGVGPEHRRHAARQALLRDVYPFEHARSRPVVVHVVLEDDEDHGEAEARHRPDGFDARGAREARGQRIGDLVVDILGRASRPVGEDDDLFLADVGNGIDVHVEDRVVAGPQDRQDGERHQKCVPERPADQSVDHGRVCC